MSDEEALLKFTLWCTPLLLSLLTGSADAAPPPAPGRQLPPVSAKDLTGRPSDVQRLLKGERNLLVAITDRKAASQMKAWFKTAQVRARGATPISVVSIGVPFFVTESDMRDQAREQVPGAYWAQMLLDTRQRMAEQLGLPREDETPWAFAVDRAGRVLAAAHCAPDSPLAEAVWRALA